MKANSLEKYKPFVIFIIVFLIAFFGTRALFSKPKKDKSATVLTEKTTDTIITTK